MRDGGSERTVSVVVPVHNSEPILATLVQRLTLVLDGLADPYEIILVNDGSRDQSWTLISRLARSDSRVLGIDLMRNYGQHNALLAGIRAARYDILVTLDDDLQNPPEEIPKLLARLDEGYDVVYGTPAKESHELWRVFASLITKWALQSAVGARTARQVSAFRAFRRHLREAFISYQGPLVSIDVLLTWGTTRFATVPVRHDPRHAGESSYTFRALVVHALNMMTGFSTLPLELASLMGFAFTVFGLVVLTFVIVRYFVAGGSVPGFPFLASIITIFAGVQLFALGIMGEYLARMHFRMMERPAYAIRSSTSGRNGAS